MHLGREWAPLPGRRPGPSTLENRGMRAADLSDTGERSSRAMPNGASQSSLVDADGRTADEMSVRVVRDDDLGGHAHKITDGARIIVQVPFPAPRQGFALAAVSCVVPGIGPDLSSHPHDVPGVWAWEEEGKAGGLQLP